MAEKATVTIAFTNNKGGSGKTTTCANLGYSLSLLGKRVLLVDGDMQLNLSLSYFDEDRVLELAAGEKNLYNGICRVTSSVYSFQNSPNVISRLFSCRIL